MPYKGPRENLLQLCRPYHVESSCSTKITLSFSNMTFTAPFFLCQVSRRRNCSVRDIGRRYVQIDTTVLSFLAFSLPLLPSLLPSFSQQFICLDTRCLFSGRGIATRQGSGARDFSPFSTTRFGRSGSRLLPCEKNSGLRDVHERNSQGEFPLSSSKEVRSRQVEALL